MPPCDEPRTRLIVALDAPTIDEARNLVATLEQSVCFYKIGLELLFGGGLDLARELKNAGISVFLDMKFLDIGNTVEKAVANVAQIGLDFLTIHGTDRKTLVAAARGRADSPLKLLAVTVMTNLEKADLEQQGIMDMTPGELALHRAVAARQAGFNGVISSGHEASRIRAQTGPEFLIVTPGIRLDDQNRSAAMGSAGADDQARIMTPARAIAAGADYLVVGRPITQAADPRAAAERFVAEIETAMATRQS